MHILFFAENSPYLAIRVGGAENSMRLMAEGLAAKGHHVTFASLRPDVLPWTRAFRRNGVEVLLLPAIRRSLAQRLLRRLGRPGEGPARRLREAGWRRLGRVLFARGRIDVLYAFYELSFLRQALRARDGAREEPQPGMRPEMRIVMRMAGLAWAEEVQRAGDGAGLAEVAALFNAVDAVNYLSPRSQELVEARAKALGLALAPRSSFVADIGVDVGAVPKLWAGPRPGEGLEIVVATRFSPYQKRQDLLVEALGLLKGRLPFRVTMIGSGATRDAVARRRDALGLGEAIEIVPFMPQERLWQTMARADLLCHPCDYEGVSKIILEAMMLGLPVLASDVDPLPDYVIEGETGFRVANTPEAWAERLAWVAATKALLPPVSDRARAFVEARFAVGGNLELYAERFAALSRG
jgi:glycosyltransferase involved in cell wall biosynthesis